MPELFGRNGPLQPSLLGANVGNKWIHPTLGMAALHCKPCEFKADPQNSQYVHLEISKAVYQHLDPVFSMAEQGRAGGETVVSYYQ